MSAFFCVPQLGHKVSIKRLLDQHFEGNGIEFSSLQKYISQKLVKFGGAHASRVSSTIHQQSRKWPMDAKPYVQSSFAVTSRTQSQHQAPFWVILGEIESTIFHV